LFFFSSRRRHTRFSRDWSSDVCSSDLELGELLAQPADDVTVVIVHAGGNRGKPVLELAANAGARKVDCPPVKRMADRLKFVVARSEERRVGKECRARWWPSD